MKETYSYARESSPLSLVFATLYPDGLTSEEVERIIKQVWSKDQRKEGRK